jgi:glucose/arabinose dehydrogenase
VPRFPTQPLLRLLCLFAANHSLASAAGPLRDAGVIYEQMCASCHGADLRGGKGGPLLVDTLKHGNDDAGIERSIRDGFPHLGMPGFGKALQEAEIRALAVFMREKTVNRPPPSENLAIDATQVRASTRHPYRIETIVDEGLQVPWSFAFLPDGRILVTERAGRLRLIEEGRLVERPIENIPAVVEKGEGGLMSVTLHPKYPENGWIYLAFSDPGVGETAMTKIVRGRLREHRFVDVEPIFEIPQEKYPEGHVLFGCRLVFDGRVLFFGIGERGVLGDAQKLGTPNGKIHRVRDDGTSPTNNPFADEPGAVDSIWAYGVRNPQGLALDPRNQALWETEHGPRGGDELNLIKPGKNYGWPAITFGINYDGTAISDKTEAPGMEQPVRNWTPSIAASPIHFYTGDKFPGWKNNLFLGSLAQQRFIRFEVERDQIVHEEEIFKNLGRIRDIVTGPDGFLYIALEQIGAKSGRIVRLVPAER